MRPYLYSFRLTNEADCLLAHLRKRSDQFVVGLVGFYRTGREMIDLTLDVLQECRHGYLD